MSIPVTLGRWSYRAVRSIVYVGRWTQAARVTAGRANVGLCSASSFYRAMLSIRGTSHGPVSVRLSVTSRSSIETTEGIELVFGT